MTHLEGGWPKDVDTTEPESKKRYLKKAEKDEKYIRATKNLCDPIEQYLKQNISLDMYGFYFEDSKFQEYATSDRPFAKTVSVFKDPSLLHNTPKRTALDMSWQPLDQKKLAVAYGMLQFQQIPNGRNFNVLHMFRHVVWFLRVGHFQSKRTRIQIVPHVPPLLFGI